MTAHVGVPAPPGMVDLMLIAARRGSDAGDAAGHARAERLLFERCAAGDARARSELIERLLPLARSVARRYGGSSEPLEDLVQVASLALVKAVDRYDPGRGVAFSSFAVPTIAGELNRHFRDRAWIVRPPRGVQELALGADRAARDLSQRDGRSPTVAELAAALSRDEEQILEALCARGARSGLSLQAGGDGEDGLEKRAAAVDAGFERAETRAMLDSLTATISPPAREILRLRFDEDMTQRQIAETLQVSQMQVSRTLRETLDRLRHIAAHQDGSVSDPGRCRCAARGTA